MQYTNLNPVRSIALQPLSTIGTILLRTSFGAFVIVLACIDTLLDGLERPIVLSGCF